MKGILRGMLRGMNMDGDDDVGMGKRRFIEDNEYGIWDVVSTPFTYARLG